MSNYRHTEGVSDRLLSRDRLFNRFKDSKYFDSETCAVSRKVATYPQSSQHFISPSKKLKISSPSLQASSCPITEQYSTARGFFAKSQESLGSSRPSTRDTRPPTRDVYENRNISSPSDATFAVCRGMLLKQLESFGPETECSPVRSSFFLLSTKANESAVIHSAPVSPDSLVGYIQEPDEISIYDDDQASYYGDDNTTTAYDELFPAPEFKARLSSSFSFPCANPWPGAASPYELDSEAAESPLYDSLLNDVQRPPPLRTAYSDSSTLVSVRRPSESNSADTAVDSDDGPPPLLPLNFTKYTSPPIAFTSPNPSSSSANPVFPSPDPALLSPGLTSWLRDPSTTSLSSPAKPPVSPQSQSMSSPGLSPGLAPPPREPSLLSANSSRTSLRSHNPYFSSQHHSYFNSDTHSIPSPYFASPSPSVQSPRSELFASPLPSPYLPPPPTLPQPTQSQSDIHPLFRRVSYSAYSPEPHLNSQEPTASSPTSSSQYTDDAISCYGDDEDHFSVGGDVIGDLGGREVRDLKNNETRRGLSKAGTRNSNALRRRNAKGRSGMLQRQDTMVSLLGYYGVGKTKELPPLPPLPMEPSGLWNQRPKEQTDEPYVGLHRRVLSDTARGYNGSPI